MLLALGRALRELRARRLLSQERLGFAADMHRNQIGAIERGEANVGFTGLVRILVALQVSLDEFAVVWGRQHTWLCADAAERRRQRSGTGAQAAR